MAPPHQLRQKLMLLAKSNTSLASSTASSSRNNMAAADPNAVYFGSPYRSAGSLTAAAGTTGPNGGRLSTSSSTVSMPACRICQLPGIEPNNPLISPCRSAIESFIRERWQIKLFHFRCLGSIRYVHNNCLLVSIAVTM